MDFTIRVMSLIVVLIIFGVFTCTQRILDTSTLFDIIISRQVLLIRHLAEVAPVLGVASCHDQGEGICLLPFSLGFQSVHE